MTESTTLTSAISIAKKSGRVSVSEVQRKLNISYRESQELCQSLVDGGWVDGLPLAPNLSPKQIAITLPPPDLRNPYSCGHCGYVGPTGPVHEHPIARIGTLCPHQATGGERYFLESTVRALVTARAGGAA